MICGNCFREIEETKVCPWCGYDTAAAEEKYPVALKAGSILNGRYIVGRVLGQGGFGITYLAQDDKTKALVAIKEYMPAEFAGRATGTCAVNVYSGDRRENFEFGKQKFLEEAKTLSAFLGDEHIVRIHSYFEENGTAYFAMEYVEGRPLDDYMKSRGGRLAPEEADALLLPLMGAMEEVHAKGIVHRDIAPDNIIVQPNGKAKLIDFGAARYSTGEKSKSLDIVIKHGFAPKEQYMRRGRQGPFTDVYAMAATYYYAVTGKVPPDAIGRLEEDDLIPPENLGVKLSDRAEEALYKALSISAMDRFQTMGEFREAMAGTGAAKPAPQEEKQPAPAPAREAPKKSGLPKWLYAAIPLVLLAAILPIALKGTKGAKEPKTPAPAAVTESTPAPEPTGVPVAKPDATAIPPVTLETPAEPEEPEEPQEQEKPAPADPSSIGVGTLLEFGAYEQDNDLTNGKEPIVWKVLARDGDLALVISQYVLDSRPYSDEMPGATWENCTLRSWLNEEFLNEAFTEEEQQIIRAETVKAYEHSAFGDGPGNDTTDRVFLLSMPEAEQYFDSKEARQCVPTAYAKAQGAPTYNDGLTWWWLRSPGTIQDCFALANTDGSVVIGTLVKNGSVRPAMWIEIRSGAPAEEQAEPEKTAALLPATTAVGDVVTFGHYEQDDDPSNGKDPIEWLVLDKQENRIFVVSKYALDCQEYNDKNVNITWETCLLRSWLNGTFFSEAFSAEEQALIPTVTVKAEKNPGYKTDPGNDTNDKVFLLSVVEANEYLTKDTITCEATKYSIAQGYHDKHGLSYWWLRSPGRNSHYAVMGTIYGDLDRNGAEVKSSIAVRPAMWIEIGSENQTVGQAEPEKTAAELPVSAAVGDTITFGHYEQDNDLTNGKEPIEWLVLDKQENRIFVISKLALDCRPYNEKKAPVTWYTCTLRNWLSDTFMNEAFSAEEQERIPLVIVDADRNQSFNSDPGGSTEDRVFLLSVLEAKEYFESDTARVCEPTAYAKAQGADMYGKSASWWLRTPGYSNYNAAGVGIYGGCGNSGAYVHLLEGIRPAMWIELG